MNEEYIEKHLARNVPLDFGECCERVRLGLAPAVNRFRRRDVRKSVEFDRYFKGMIRILIDGDVSPDLDQKIGEEIFEVQVRFEAIQKTIDYSVPAKPVHESLQMLKKDNNKSYKKIYEETRDINVKQLTGLDVDDEIPNDINSFRSAKSIAERVSIAGSFLKSFGNDLDEIIEYFDHKRGLVTKGKRSVYAVLYAIIALAEIFDRYNEFNKRASVQLSPNQTMMRNQPSYVYSGFFLDFVMQFFFAVDHAEIERYSHSGLHDTIRKISSKKKRDPDLYKLLNGDEVGPEKILEFMKRADELKK